MSVTIVSCLYGDNGFDVFLRAWERSINALTHRPDEVLLLTDRAVESQAAHVVVSECGWEHPQAYYLERAVLLALTDWVWILDIDDAALPDALDGIDDVCADVWQMGYERSDGVTHIAPQLTAAEYLALDGNPFSAGSAFRVEAFKACGGFPDVAFQDWGLWRRLAANGATFASSGRAHYRYNRHAATRSATELRPELRADHVAEMLAGRTHVA